MEFLNFLLYFALSIPILHLLITSLKHKNHRLPPGPRGLPIIGNLLSLSARPHQAFSELAKQHGPILTVNLGLTTTVVLSSAELAKEALQTKDQLLSDRWIPDVTTVLGYSESSIIWLPPNQSWKQLRAISASHLLSAKSLEASKQLRRRKAREMVAFLREKSGKAVEVGGVVFDSVFSTMSNLLFSLDGEGGEFGRVFREQVNTLSSELAKPNVSDIFPAVRWLDLQGRRRCAQRHLRKLFDLFDEIIERRLRSGVVSGSGDFLESLIRLQSESLMDRHTMRVLLLDLLGGGTHTTSMTLEWAMAELLRNPAIMAKLNSELAQVTTNNHEIEESDVERLPYLQATVKEVLRLHAPGPFLLPHKASDDVELGGYLVPKGTQVLLNIWAMARDDKVWADPEEFRPERFLEREIEVRGRDFELVPFGSGRRSCPGTLMALRMLHLLLATLLSSFEWSLPDGMSAKDLDMTETFGNALGMAVPLRAVPLPRQ